MQKKKRLRLRNNLTVQYWTVVILCLTCAVYSSRLFYRSFYQSLRKLNEEPIATITFKHKTAQRKILDRVVWDRLQQNSPVYNGDTIHTAEQSEATIWFTDGNVMELAENSMAQVFLNENKTLTADISSGEFFVDSTESSSGITLSSSGVTVAVAAGASVNAGASKSSEQNAAQETKAFSVQVVSGEASVSKEGQEVQSLAAGESVAVAGEAVVIPELSVLSPKPNERILFHTAELHDIPVKWKRNNSENEIISIVFAKDKEFKEIILSEQTENTNEYTVQLTAGTYYWKIGNASLEATGRFQILESLPPEAITPVNNYEYNFRTKLPAVRFIWSESSMATAYRLVVAEDKDLQNVVVEQRVSSASAIISTLKEGSYYWQVTPYFPINHEGFTSPSEINSFVIEKKGSLSKLVPFLPADNGTLNTEKNARDTFFSWNQNPEAESYRIVIADNENLLRPAINKVITGNSFAYSPSANSLKDGKWYWAVTMKDIEGNESPLSDVRSFYAMKGNPVQHVIEPSDGYLISSGLVPDTKFTWKMSVPENFVTVVQFAKDKNFNEIITENKVSGTSYIKNLSFDIGTYYWRLVSVCEADATVLTSDAKCFKVVGNLEPSELILKDNRAVARENEPFKFTWKEVPGADYYRITVYEDSTNEIVYDETCYEAQEEIYIYDSPFTDRTMYRFAIQAQALAVPGVSSRRVSTVSEDKFLLVKLKPVEVTSPRRNAVLDGEKAVLEPYSLSWSSVDAVKQAQIVVTKTDEKKPVTVLKSPTDIEMQNGRKIAPKTILLDTQDGLKSGTYEVVVYAKTFDDIDITNREEKRKGRFTVSKIPPLPSLKSLKVMPELFDAAYLRNQENPKTIIINWDSVPNATGYQITLTDKNNYVIYEDEIKELSYALDFMQFTEEDKKKFSKGIFTLSVKAVRRIDLNKDGTLDRILQESEVSSVQFKTDVPSPKKVKVKGAKNPYAK